MLLKSKISSIVIHTDEWRAARLAKFTSSHAVELITDAALIKYVRKKVHEELTGITTEKEVDVDATRHGLMYEIDSVRKLAIKLKLEFIIVQQLVTAEGSRFGSTPDALIVVGMSPDGEEYEVETVESKSPPDNYIELFECLTPADLKKTIAKYYWQVLDQMDECKARKGHFIAYHPDFRAGNFRHIVFDLTEKMNGKYLLQEDMKLLRSRKKLALEKFEELRDRLISQPNL